MSGPLLPSKRTKRHRLKDPFLCGIMLTLTAYILPSPLLPLTKKGLGISSFSGSQTTSVVLVLNLTTPLGAAALAASGGPLSGPLPSLPPALAWASSSRVRALIMLFLVTALNISSPPAWRTSMAAVGCFVLRMGDPVSLAESLAMPGMTDVRRLGDLLRLSCGAVVPPSPER